MKKVFLVLLVTVLALNLSSAQEEYKLTSFANNGAVMQIKGIVTYVDGIFTVTPKDKKFPKMVYNLNEWDEIEGATVINTLPQGHKVYKSIQTSQVRYTLSIAGKYDSFFLIETKDSLTEAVYTLSISFKM